MAKLKERIEKALQANPNIVVSPKDIENTLGFELEYLESLGITKSDLKRLERHGLAVRGYTNNGRGLFFNKEKNKWYKEFRSGHRVRWFLLAPESIGGTNVGTNE